jgi:SAM-dependent methyltransferase
VPGFPGKAGETFDSIAEPFDATRREPWPFVSEWLGTLPTLAGPILDVGCGNGRHLEPAMKAGMSGIGIDASRRLLGIARSRLGSGPVLVLGDARRLPLRDGSVEAVMAVALLHHLRSPEDRRAVVGELRRVLGTGAPVLLSTWALDDPTVAGRARVTRVPEGDDQDLLVPWRAPGGPQVDRYYRVVPLDELSALVAGEGLSVEEARRWGANNVVIARSP